VVADSRLKLATRDSILAALVHTLEFAGSCTDISFLRLTIEISTLYFLAIGNINTCTITFYYLKGTANQDIVIKTTLNVSTPNCFQNSAQIV